MKSSLWTAAALGLALTLGACTDGNLGNLEVSSDSNHPLAAPPVAAVPQQLVQLMAGAPEAVVFQGTRRYEAYWDYEGSPEELIYREDVVTNGQGGFSIDPAELISPPLSSSGEDIFLLLQKTREGFFFGHRDFSIRDLQLFLKQWTVLDLGQTTFLGRSAVLLDVRRQDNPDGYYLLTVDDQNGLVLRAEERSLAGFLRSLVEFESLSFMPSLTGVNFHQSFTTETVVKSSSSLLALLSFAPAQPKLLPPGFELMETASVVEPGQGGSPDRNWARFTYGDGVEEIFFLHEGRAAKSVTKAGLGQGAGQGAGSGGPAGSSPKSGTGKPPGPTDTVQFVSVGPWTVLFGEIDGDAFMAMGKVSREALRDLVESAFF